MVIVAWGGRLASQIRGVGQPAAKAQRRLPIEVPKLASAVKGPRPNPWEVLPRYSFKLGKGTVLHPAPSFSTSWSSLLTHPPLWDRFHRPIVIKLFRCPCFSLAGLAFVHVPNPPNTCGPLQAHPYHPLDTRDGYPTRAYVYSHFAVYILNTA